MIPRHCAELESLLVWLVALCLCGTAVAQSGSDSLPTADAQDGAESFRVAEERHAAGDAEGVYVAAERARGVAEPVSVADLRSKLLDVDQVLLESLVGREATLLVLVSQDRCRSASVVVGRDSLAALADSLREQIRAGEAVPHAAVVLHELLIEPLNREIPPEARLVLVVDAPIDRVPLAALHDGTTFLVERHPLSSTPSATALRAVKAGGEIVVLPFDAVPPGHTETPSGESPLPSVDASLPLGESPPPSVDASLPLDVALQRVQRAAIGSGNATREWALWVATGRMHAPRRPSGQFPAWPVPIGMALGGLALVLALRRIPRATGSS